MLYKQRCWSRLAAEKEGSKQVPSMCVKQENEQRNQVVYLTNHMEEETERFPTTVKRHRAMMLSAAKAPLSSHLSPQRATSVL